VDEEPEGLEAPVLVEGDEAPAELDLASGALLALFDADPSPPDDGVAVPELSLLVIPASAPPALLSTPPTAPEAALS